MPFTLSHPAAAIPLRRPLGRLAVLPALVIGSVSPDLPYYLPISVPRGTTHTAAALLWFCVPVSLLAYVVFTRLEAPLAFLMPAPVRARLPAGRPPRLTLAHLGAVAVSAAAGALTHLVWDSFTHASGAAVRAWRPFWFVVAELPGYRLSVFKLLQHASTLVGLSLLVLWTLRWVHRTPPVAGAPASRAPVPEWTRRPLLCASLGAALLIALLRTARHGPVPSPVLSAQIHLRVFTVAAIGVLALCLCAFALAWHLRARRSAP